MRFISYSDGQSTTWGAVVDFEGQELVVNLSALASSLKVAIETGRLTDLQVDASGDEPALSDVSLLPPISDPEKIICIGVNYANRNAEYKDGSEAPKNPSVFLRTPDSLTGHHLDLMRPPESQQLDYEGEIVVIIGKEGRRIKEEDAFDHIAGLTIMNEGTLRDWVRHAKFNVTQGKNFVHSGSLGPWMVSIDEFTAEQLKHMTVQTRVNGELRQNDTTANMMFPIAYQIAYLSKFFKLKAGDIIATGTPNGAGARFDPPKYLVPGDVVEIEVPEVGLLRNGVADEVIS